VSKNTGKRYLPVLRKKGKKKKKNKKRKSNNGEQLSIQVQDIRDRDLGYVWFRKGPNKARSVDCYDSLLGVKLLSRKVIYINRNIIYINYILHSHLLYSHCILILIISILLSWFVGFYIIIYYGLSFHGPLISILWIMRYYWCLFLWDLYDDL